MKSLRRSPYLPPPEEPPSCLIPGASRRDRSMVFVKPDENFDAVFTMLRQTASNAKAALLIVSIIPLALVCGELKAYKASLFRNLAAELMQCRRSNMLWGLRVLETADRNRCASMLAQQYQPDRIVTGMPRKGRVIGRLRRSLMRTLARKGWNVEVVGG